MYISGSTTANGLAIKYRESDNSLRFIKLIICENDKKTSLNWVTAMIKVPLEKKKASIIIYSITIAGF